MDIALEEIVTSTNLEKKNMALMTEINIKKNESVRDCNFIQHVRSNDFSALQ